MEQTEFNTIYIYVRTKEYKHWSTVIKETCDYYITKCNKTKLPANASSKTVEILRHNEKCPCLWQSWIFTMALPQLISSTSCVTWLHMYYAAIN